MSHKALVLLVEDEKGIRNFISTVLDVNNYRVVEARDGKEALELFTSRCPDLILLDLGLPDMDGIEVLKTIRGWSGIPIIVVSARGHEREKVEALDLGADDYITKPFGTSELLARIRTAMRHQQVTVDVPERTLSVSYTHLLFALAQIWRQRKQCPKAMVHSVPQAPCSWGC